MKKVICIVLVALFGLSSVKAYCDEVSIAVVLTEIGNVSAVSKDKQKRPLKRGAPLFVGDTIVTEAVSKAHIRFLDGTKIAIEDNSSISLDAYRYLKDKSDKQEVSLLGGGIRWLSGDIQSKSQQATKLKTNVALTGIRGTYFLAVYSNNTEILGIYKGAGYLQNEGGTAYLGEDDSFHLAAASSWTVAPKYLREDLKEFFSSFRPIKGNASQVSDAGLDSLQAGIPIDDMSDSYDDWFDSDLFFPNGPWQFDFAYNNYFNSCHFPSGS